MLEKKHFLSLTRPVRNQYQSQMKVSNGAGFTFIELLVSILIFSIIVVSLYSAFRVGLTAYKKGEQVASLHQRLRLCLDQIALDFRNSYKFSDADSGFKGENNRISFYCLKKINSSQGKSFFQICRIEYSQEQGRLSRSLFASKLAFSDASEVKPEILLDKASKIIIEFPYQREGTDDVIWKDYWLEKDKLPLGVKIDLEIKQSENLAQPIKLTKFINIPLGEFGKE